jgi:ABC-2 type transport system ATP-binding protein
MPPAILTEKLTKRFGARAVVRELDLEVAAGEIFGFLGPNGAGKTTTIAMLLHLVRPTSGRALLLGHDVWAEPRAALASVGAMLEAPAFYPYMSGYHNLLALARAEGLPARRVEAVLELIGLLPHARRAFGHYSQGMRQRLAIGAVLLREPQILILDEPLNGLDPGAAYDLRALLRTLSEAGRTIFFSSHMLSDVQQLCQRVAVLKEGQVIAQGGVEELLQGEGGLLVRVAGDPAPAMELLRALPWVASVEVKERQLLVVAPAERAAELNRLLVGAGIDVAELRPREMVLEEFFLRIVGEGRV